MFLIRQMCDKAILENGGTLSLFLTATKTKTCVIKQLVITLMHYNVSECYKTRKIRDKAPTIKYVPKCDKTQEMCNKAGHRCVLYLILFLINIKLKKYVT